MTDNNKIPMTDSKEEQKKRLETARAWSPMEARR